MSDATKADTKIENSKHHEKVKAPEPVKSKISQEIIQLSAIIVKKLKFHRNEYKNAYDVTCDKNILTVIYKTTILKTFRCIIVIDPDHDKQHPYPDSKRNDEFFVKSSVEYCFPNNRVTLYNIEQAWDMWVVVRAPLYWTESEYKERQHHLPPKQAYPIGNYPLYKISTWHKVPWRSRYINDYLNHFGDCVYCDTHHAIGCCRWESFHGDWNLPFDLILS